MLFSRAKTEMVSPERALRGRSHYEFSIPEKHYVNGRPIQPPFPDGLQSIVLGTPQTAPVPDGFEEVWFGTGCFWGTEEIFWQAEGVYTTAVGYAGGFTPNPTYEEVCSGRTGHAEVVLVVFDPGRISYDELLRIFWENHDPTQGMRQGNDVGTQYRSAIYTFSEDQLKAAEASRHAYQDELTAAGHGTITTEIREAPTFYYAEAYHQQYLARNPYGYCGLGGTGVSCPTGLRGPNADAGLRGPNAEGEPAVETAAAETTATESAQDD